MPRIAILGGSGRLGDRLVGLALEGGYRVNVLTRNPANIQRHAEALTVSRGDAETGEGLGAAVRGCRLVVCAISSKKAVIAQCTSNLVKELQGSPVLERFVFLSRVGVGDSREQGRKVSGVFQSYLPSVKPRLFEDLAAAEGVLRASSLPYLILRPTMLTDDIRQHQVVAVKADAETPGRIPRRELAAYIFRVLEAPGWTSGEFTVGTARR